MTMFNRNRKLMIYVFAPIFALAILLGACAGAASPDEEWVVQREAEFAPEPAIEGIEMAASGFDEEQFLRSTYNEEQPQDRLVIKDADLAIVVTDPSASMDAIAVMAEQMGGFVVSGNLYHRQLESGEMVPEASITIRVPAEHLNEALELIQAESEQDPIRASISSQDVTPEYVDLQSRLRNLEAAEAQLAKIMEEAEETEDVLAVYNELVRVQGEIEVIKGRIKYLEQSAALSSIHTELLANEAVQPLTIGGWQPVGVVKNAVQALIDAVKFLVNAGIWVVIFVLPVLLILFIFVFLPARWIWRKLRPRKDGRQESEAAKIDQSQSTNQGE